MIILAVCGIIFVGCDSLTQQRKHPLTAEEQQTLQEQRRISRERRAAKEDARRLAESERRAHERQREEAKQLRERYERYTTAELKLMHQRYLELASGAGGRDLNVRVNSLVPSESDKKQMERVVEIERELLRRWKNGDADARLPSFEDEKM